MHPRSVNVEGRLYIPLNILIRACPNRGFVSNSYVWNTQALEPALCFTLTTGLRANRAEIKLKREAGGSDRKEGVVVPVLRVEPSAENWVSKANMDIADFVERNIYFSFTMSSEPRSALMP